MPEINFGFVPGGQIVKAVGRMALPRALSYAALTGRPFDAEQAVRWGFATAVDSDPLARAIAFAQEQPV
jgi:enoyl-CoA hydratase/carnithine racemase